MIRPFAFIFLLASTVVPLGRTQQPAVAAAGPVPPLVTYDIVGTFPANVPVTRITAPRASFLLEISFPQIELPFGRIRIKPFLPNPVGLPISVLRPPSTPDDSCPIGTATFLAVDSGPQGAWNYTFTNVRGQSITGYTANVFDVAGRLVVPKVQPLAAP